jgi:23S rRNA (adenine2503-C2)-methyltransferase
MVANNAAGKNDTDLRLEVSRMQETMKGIVTYKVPTGNIGILTGSTGKQLEFLSIGDYGNAKNVKADFLGLTDEINGVSHGELLPLEKKWVITISSQYGCSMGCTFCDVPKVGPGTNASYDDIMQQVYAALALHPEVTSTERLNLHYARMGEPTWNLAVIPATWELEEVLRSRKPTWGFHPVISTMMPKNNPKLEFFLNEWMGLKAAFKGEAGLQLSINTTDKAVRAKTMHSAMDLELISTMMTRVLRNHPVRGRKITLNFALTEAAIDAKLLSSLFDPKDFLCKITPMHNTAACVKNGLLTDHGYDAYYPYQQAEQDLKDVGFDVIVFIPSHEEDASKITCGNAILATGLAV